MFVRPIVCNVRSRNSVAHVRVGFGTSHHFGYIVDGWFAVLAEAIYLSRGGETRFRVIGDIQNYGTAAVSGNYDACDDLVLGFWFMVGLYHRSVFRSLVSRQVTAGDINVSGAHGDGALAEGFRAGQ